MIRIAELGLDIWRDRVADVESESPAMIDIHTHLLPEWTMVRPLQASAAVLQRFAAERVSWCLHAALDASSAWNAPHDRYTRFSSDSRKWLPCSCVTRGGNSARVPTRICAPRLSLGVDRHIGRILSEGMPPLAVEELFRLRRSGVVPFWPIRNGTKVVPLPTSRHCVRVGP